MKKVAMIPARLGSKRVPKKNLRLILGKPLIAYIIEAAKASNAFDEIYINSEADIFGEIAEEAARAPCIKGIRSSGTEILCEGSVHIRLAGLKPAISGQGNRLPGMINA